jgi:hypothetical protein
MYKEEQERNCEMIHRVPGSPFHDVACRLRGKKVTCPPPVAFSVPAYDDVGRMYRTVSSLSTSVEYFAVLRFSSVRHVISVRQRVSLEIARESFYRSLELRRIQVELVS